MKESDVFGEVGVEEEDYVVTDQDTYELMEGILFDGTDQITAREHQNVRGVATLKNTEGQWFQYVYYRGIGTGGSFLKASPMLEGKPLKSHSVSWEVKGVPAVHKHMVSVLRERYLQRSSYTTYQNFWEQLEAMEAEEFDRWMMALPRV